jgi:hypothetical protein
MDTRITTLVVDTLSGPGYVIVSPNCVCVVDTGDQALNEQIAIEALQNADMLPGDDPDCCTVATIRLTSPVAPL